MIEKIKKYLAENMKDPVTRCNFISRILRGLIFGSLSIILFVAIIAMWIIHIDTLPHWLEVVMAILIGVGGQILVCSAKVFLVVIPVIWLIQCWDCIKNKRDNKFVVSNLILWFFIAMFTIWAINSNKDEEECMKACVKEDQSNYNECLYSICD